MPRTLAVALALLAVSASRCPATALTVTSATSENATSLPYMNSLGGSFASSARTAINLVLNNFNGYPLVPEPTHTDTTDGNNYGIPTSAGQNLVASLLGYIGTYAQDVGGDYTLGGDLAGVYGGTICAIGSAAMPDLIDDIKFNTRLLGRGPYNAGIGAGWGFQLYCNDEQLFTFGMGLGGGVATDAGVSAYSGGFGGGGGASADSFSAGGGGGFAFAFGQPPLVPCNASSDPGASRTFALPSDRVHAISACLAQGRLAVCGGGGGGGGFSSASGHWGGGFTFTIAGTVGTTTTPSRPANCPRGTTGRGSGGAGVAATACRAACDGGPEFYRCYCRCFKEKVSRSAAPWVEHMQCPP